MSFMTKFAASFKDCRVNLKISCTYYCCIVFYFFTFLQNAAILQLVKCRLFSGHSNADELAHKIARRNGFHSLGKVGTARAINESYKACFVPSLQITALEG